jgi:hypothetical protein
MGEDLGPFTAEPRIIAIAYKCVLAELPEQPRHMLWVIAVKQVDGKL